jgi:hypothetical protein
MSAAADDYMRGFDAALAALASRDSNAIHRAQAEMFLAGEEMREAHESNHGERE